MTVFRPFLLILLACLLMGSSAHADEASIRAGLAKFADAKGFAEIEAVVRELGATGDPAVSRPLAALADGNLYIRKAD